MLFNYQSSCAAHQATRLFYQMFKRLSTTFLIFLISYFQTTYESVLFRAVLADSLYIIPSLPSSVNTFFHFFQLFCSNSIAKLNSTPLWNLILQIIFVKCKTNLYIKGPERTKQDEMHSGPGFVYAVISPTKCL